MKIRTYLQILTLLIGLTTCQKEKIASREYPRVKTLQVSEINESGATFKGEIISGKLQDIEEYGFVWNMGDKVVSKEPIRGNNFTCRVHSALKKGNTYEVKAYVKTKDYQVFGPSVSFISLGSEAPVITDFNKKSGTWGDTVKISGKNFRYRINAIEVIFGDMDARILNSTDTTIFIQVPSVKNTPSPYITVSMDGNSSRSSAPFLFNIPQISSVSPQSFSFNDTLTISGNNFIRDTLAAFVNLDGKRAKYIAFSSTLIKVTVPVNLTSLQPKLSITGPAGDIEYGSPLSLKPIQLTSFSPDTVFTSDQIITIKGENFNPVSLNNKVSVKGIDAAIVSSSKTEIKVRVPASLAPTNEFSILTNGEISVTSSQQVAKFDKKLELCFKRKWTRKKNFPGTGRMAGIGFALGEKGYVGMGYSGQESASFYTDFWGYNPKTDEWTQKADFPGTPRLFQSSFTLGNEAYVGLGSQTRFFGPQLFLNDFYKYNPQNDSWIRIPDYPGSARAYATAFVKNGKGYVGTGRIKVDDPNLQYGEFAMSSEMWSWDPLTNQWNSAPAYPLKTMYVYGFNIGEKAYTYEFQNGITEFQDPSWVKRNNQNIGSSEITVFGLGSQAYFTTTGQWNIFKESTGQLTSYYPPWEVRNSLPSIFVINNKAYFVCGSQSGVTQSVWEFDPTK